MCKPILTLQTKAPAKCAHDKKVLLPARSAALLILFAHSNVGSGVSTLGGGCVNGLGSGLSV
jgi:hypothetical protein